MSPKFSSKLTERGTLLVFAHEAEAEAFVDVPHLVTGIGKVSAASTLAHQLLIESRLSVDSAPGLNDVREIVVLGTAGLIDDSLDLDTVYRVRGALQHDLAFDPPVAELGANGKAIMHGKFTGKSKVLNNVDFASAESEAGNKPVAGNEPEASTTIADNSEDYGEATAIIATGDAFVSDDELRASLAERGASLVDMESYAYAAVAAQFEVAIRIYKVPSDFADSATTDETWDDIVLRKSHQLYEFAQSKNLF